MLLVIGGGLLAAGLVIAGLSGFVVAKQIIEGGTLIEPTSIEPGLSFAAVLKDLPAQRQLVLSINSEPSDAPLSAVITQADGSPIGTYNITGTPFTTTLMTAEPGDHTLELKNVGTLPVTVEGALINSPVSGEGGGVSVENDPELQALLTYTIGVLAGIVLIVAGIIIIIIGAIKHFRSRKARESVPSG